MEVKTITKYSFKGKEFNSLKEIKEELHNRIGTEVLDKITKTCPLQKHADYLKLLNLLCSKEVRKVLLECLSVTHTEVELSGEYNQYEENIITNILDS